MDLGKSIRLAIEKKGITRSHLAAQLGCGRPNITYMIKTGRVTSETLRRIAAAFDMKVSEFVAIGED